MKILIDADGCPVVRLAVDIAQSNGIECLIFCDTAHVLDSHYAQVITLAKGADSVDFALVNKANQGDVVITQDYGLAAMCLAKAALVISQNGLIYDQQNIDGLLNQRHHAKKVRLAGGRLKGNPKRSKTNDLEFTQALKQLIQDQLEKTSFKQ